MSWSKDKEQLSRVDVISENYIIIIKKKAMVERDKRLNKSENFKERERERESKRCWWGGAIKALQNLLQGFHY